MSERIAKNLRRDFYDSVLNKDVEFFEHNRTGDLCKFGFN
jgi:ABC-type bacteriocin/lantibiotic exporter with double-glycine peptidase domain